MKISSLLLLFTAFLLALSGCSSVTTVSEYSVYDDISLPDNTSSKEQTSAQQGQASGGASYTESSSGNNSHGSQNGSAVRSGEAPNSSQSGEGSGPVEITEFSENQVEFIGRFSKEKSGYRFCWSGSTVSAGFNGTELAVRMELSYIISDKGNADYVEVFIDGVRQDTLRITKFNDYYKVASGLEDGYHYVSLVKRTEGCFSTLTFKGFDYLSGEAAPAPARSERRIEFLGDSITAGYGNTAAGGSVGFRMSQEDATNTYGYLTAASLGAEATIIASSGNGFAVKNLDSSIKPGDELIDYSVLNSDVKYSFQSASRPDVLVINFGANDFAQGCDPAEYREKYSRFLDKVRQVYPDTYIVCAIGTHSVSSAYPHIQTVVNERISAGDSRIASFKFTATVSLRGMSGADNHPSVECHKIMADELSYFLRNKLGW